MAKQVNLYLNQVDISRIEGYLQDRGWQFVYDGVYEASQAKFLKHLLEDKVQAGYIALHVSTIKFNEWTEAGQTCFRISGVDSDLVSFDYFGEKDGMHRLRFYYDSRGNDIQDKAVEQFFKWLRSNFDRIADMPRFYKSKQIAWETYF